MITSLLIVYAILMVWAVISIFLFGSRPARSIAWLFVVILVPFLGVLLYILFGINRKKFKFFTPNSIAKRRSYKVDYNSDIVKEFKKNFTNEDFKDVGILMEKSSGFPALNGNNVEILHNPKEAFDNIFDEIEKAKSFIHIQYYLIEKGKILNKFSDLLHKKMDEGVEVRIIYDALGSYVWRNRAIAKLKKSGAKVFSILPINIKTILSTINFRNHRKLIIIDGLIAYTGGINITDKYINKADTTLGAWEDLHLKIKGFTVDQLHRVFIKDYYFATKQKESLLEDLKYLPQQKEEGNHLLQTISGGPDLDFSAILHQYLMMINSASKKICIQNPYFIPNRMLLEALKMACLRGVNVIVMIPKENDSALAKHSMYANFEDLLLAGVEIRIVEDHFFHTKLISVDDKIASIGSGNFDYRSFEFNYELNMLIYDQKLCQEINEEFDMIRKKADQLDYETFKNRPLRYKLLQGMAKMLSPLL